MNRRFTLVTARLAIWLFKLRTYIAVAVCAVAFGYCWAASGIIEFSQTKLESCLDGLIEDVRQLRLRAQSALDETAIAAQKASSQRTFVPRSIDRSRARLEAYGIHLRSALLDTASDMVGLSIRSMGGAIAVSSAQIRAVERNTESLDTIFNKPPSPISGLELILWMVTHSSHVNDTLGDFRETYEIKRAKSGTYAAITWARSQVYRDVQNRIGTISKIVGWLITGLAWFKKSIHKH